jgi:N-acyl-D-aspartate/D-glutamate deacylase
MQALLEEALDAGAVGMSTGTYYRLRRRPAPTR